nr:hypothetical protein BaRGS_009387 [Batillaria attramentaria]
MEVNCYFLTVDKTCEKNDCRGETEYDPSLENSVASCRCLKCQENHTRESSVWRKFCMKRAHRYWHKHVPSPLVVHMTVRNQQTLTTVARALGHLQAAINDLDRDCAAGHSTSDDCHADPVERLYHQGVGITRIVRHFLQLIPGARQLGQDVEMLVQGAGFGTAVILVGSQGFDAECRRFRQLWTWTVPTSSPLFSFKVNLLTLAGRVHGIALDKMETALLCAICLLSTDVDGLQNPEAVEDARRVLLDGLEAYISSRDQWPSVRVKRLFSIMPEIRLVTAWHSGLLASIRPREQPQANASPNPVTSL